VGSIDVVVYWEMKCPFCTFLSDNVHNDNDAIFEVLFVRDCLRALLFVPPEKLTNKKWSIN
jgi:hypothetical protein